MHVCIYTSPHMYGYMCVCILYVCAHTHTYTQRGCRNGTKVNSWWIWIKGIRESLHCSCNFSVGLDFCKIKTRKQMKNLSQLSLQYHKALEFFKSSGRLQCWLNTSYFFFFTNYLTTVTMSIKCKEWHVPCRHICVDETAELRLGRC